MITKMTNFIEEFYYGNLDPQARSTKENKTVQKQMEILMLNEDFLTENLFGENKKNAFLSACGHGFIAFRLREKAGRREQL